VRFYFKRDSIPVTDVDQSRILGSCLYKHAATRSRKGFKLQNGILVRAMLAPHHTVHAEFGHCGCTSKYVADLFKLGGCQAKLLRILCVRNNLGE
jgi:hypothetical protein